jgi:hypothetical protein
MSDNEFSINVDLVDGRTISLTGELPKDAHRQVIMRVRQSWFWRKKFKVTFFAFIQGDENGRLVEEITDHD